MPTRLQSANNASTTLGAAMGATDTSLSVASAAGFPSVPFRITIDNEIIEVGAVSGNTFSTLTRGLEGTAAAAHNSGATVDNRWTSGTYSELAAMIVAATAPMNPSLGLFWLNTASTPYVLNQWNGTTWQGIASGGGTFLTNPIYRLGL